VAGLMVGRTPEYLGKKIESYEMKMSSLVILITPALVLIGTSVGVVTAAGKAGIANPGIHGFSEILYAFSSASNNNGSAFAGLSANTPFYNTALGLCMLFGRYWLAVPVLAIAGALARKKIVPVGAGTLPTHTPLFVGLLVGVVLLVGALTFVPALALGPVVEHLTLIAAKGGDRAMAGTVRARSLFDATIVRQAIVDSFRKLTPRRQVRNPVMFVVYVGSILTTLLWAQAVVGHGEAPGWFIFWVSVWL